MNIYNPRKNCLSFFKLLRYIKKKIPRQRRHKIFSCSIHIGTFGFVLDINVFFFLPFLLLLLLLVLMLFLLFYMYVIYLKVIQFLRWSRRRHQHHSIHETTANQTNIPNNVKNAKFYAYHFFFVKHFLLFFSNKKTIFSSLSKNVLYFV